MLNQLIIDIIVTQNKKGNKMIKLFQVLSQCDAYICQDWFYSEFLANRHATERDGKEHIVNEFVVTKEFVEVNYIDPMDCDAMTEHEWDIIESFHEEKGLEPTY